MTTGIRALTGVALLVVLCGSVEAHWVGTRVYPSNQTRPWSWEGSMSALMSWTPASDPDRDYNRGRIPLHPRFSNPAYWVNANARNEGYVATVGPWYPSEEPEGYVSYGADYFRMYTYSFWQYVDIFIVFNNWNQSMSAELFDIAHRNGVRVYNLIMNPTAADMAILLKKDSHGHFPGAGQLIKIAKYYGFDGWFFNLESAGNRTLAAQLREFFIYFNRVGTPQGVRAMMYDSWIEDGSVSYQNELNTKNDWYFQYKGKPAAHEFFLNYWFTQQNLVNSKNTANSFARSEYDVYAGFQVWQDYWESNGVLRYPVTDIFPDGQPHLLSLACFQMNGSFDKASSNRDYYLKEEQFFTGYNHDPSDTNTANDWRGVANYYPGKSVIHTLPFFTNFNTGQGHLYAINGTVMHNGDWYNRGLQDILPTWRWVVQSSGATLRPEFDWSDAYYGGTCLKVSGNLSADNLIKLYMTKLRVSAGTKLDIAFKTGTSGAPTYMQVGLSFTDNPTSYTFLDVGRSHSAGWNLKTLDLSAHAGKTIGAISLKFLAGGGTAYNMKVGRFGVYDGAIKIPAAPTGLTVVDKVEDKQDIASVRLKWTHAPGNTWYYNIYRRRPDNTLEHIGGTTINAHLVPWISRVGAETTTTVELETVSPSFGHSRHAVATFHWVGAAGLP